MSLDPIIGEESGQDYDVAQAIRTFLNQMSEGVFNLSSAVIKELLQNSDDAEATEVVVILDERCPSDNLWENIKQISKERDKNYYILTEPALLVMNNSKFRLPGDENNPDKNNDDFKAIRTVSGGHKLAQPTTAGRFGIGFNSVYFLTDTPVIFSRREMHIFDLLHQVCNKNGWKIPIESLRKSNNDPSETLGPLKQILNWILPKAALLENDFLGLANDNVDYKYTLFRLPLRRSIDVKKPMHEQEFNTEEARLKLLKEMAEEATRSIIFLKHIKSITFKILTQEEIKEICKVEIIEDRYIKPDIAYDEFIRRIKNFSTRMCFEFNNNSIKNLKDKIPGKLNLVEAIKNEKFFEKEKLEIKLRNLNFDKSEIDIVIEQAVKTFQSCGSETRFPCSFIRKVKFSSSENDAPVELSFYIKHKADFFDEEIVKHRNDLFRNNGKAIPWCSIAVPLDKTSIEFEHLKENPYWRVFLPLCEQGPSRCILNGAFFVGVSRKYLEFNTEGSDEAKRKTEWNKLLIDKILISLLQDISEEILELCPDFIKDYPEDYLSFFPLVPRKKEMESLSEFFQDGFVSQKTWELTLYDLEKQPITLPIWNSEFFIELQMIPEWLSKYKDGFLKSSDENCRFISYKLGEILNKRLEKKICIEVTSDILRKVLLWDYPPDGEDLVRIFERLRKLEAKYKNSYFNADYLQGVWCFKRFGNGEFLRYHKDVVYVIKDLNSKNGIHSILQTIGLEYDKVEWVESEMGLPVILHNQRIELSNIFYENNNSSVIEVLNRIKDEYLYDRINMKFIRPVVDFLLSITTIPQDLRLGFLVRTAQNKLDRKKLGIILLKPESLTDNEKALWEGLFKRMFSELHPDSAKEVRRLIKKYPWILDMMHDTGCDIYMATEENALEILHKVRFYDPESYGAFSEEINKFYRNSEPIPGNLEELSSFLIEYAYNKWDSFTDEYRESILRLPIHIKSDREFISLINDEFNIESLKDKYQLQSEDEEEASVAITLPNKILLRSDYYKHRFYRLKLNLEVRGRILMLKEVLRVIGNDENLNIERLDYIFLYYTEIIKKLEARKNDEVCKKDLDDLKKLFKDARLVLCIDNVWRKAQECYKVWDIAKELREQDWEYKKLPSLLKEVFSGKYIATLKEDIKNKTLSLAGLSLNKLDLRDLFICSIKSESSELLFKDRVKLISDNIIYRPEFLVPMASTIGNEDMEVLSGRIAFKDIEIFEYEDISLPEIVIKHIIPKALKFEVIKEKLMLEKEKFLQVSGVLGIQKYDNNEFNERLIKNFSRIWNLITHENKFALLQYIGKNKLSDRLISTVESLKVIFTGKLKSEWVEPINVIAPRWLVTIPSLLEESQMPNLEKVEDDVIRVWNSWCSLKDIKDIIEVMVEKANSKEPSYKIKEHANELYSWLDRMADNSKNEKDFSNILNNLSWVLAEKDSSYKFIKPSDVINHPGRDIIKKYFWVPALSFPKVVEKWLKNYSFTEEPEANVDNIKYLAFSLAEAGKSEKHIMINVYKLILRSIRSNRFFYNQHKFKEDTGNIAFYHLFREPEKLVTVSRLFIGDENFSEDFGELLFCLRKNNNVPDSIVNIYEELGINITPTIGQITMAFSELNGKGVDLKEVYKQLVNAIFTFNQYTENFKLFLSKICVLTCSGFYKPLYECYWDEDIGKPVLLSPQSSYLVIDNTDKITRNLIEWLSKRFPEVIHYLDNEINRIEILGEPEEVKDKESLEKISQFIESWKELLKQLSRKDTKLYHSIKESVHRLDECEINLEFLGFIPVENISIQFILNNGYVVMPSKEWKKQRVFFDNKSKIFIRFNREDDISKITLIKKIDEEIAEEISEIISGEKNNILLKEIILENLERPSVYLKKLRDRMDGFIYHQYQDQSSDPEFAKLFEEWQQVDKRVSNYLKLKEEMRQIIEEKFINMRCKQIRSHGYDEASIFTELIQNAEDAYIQRDVLKMDKVDPASITFTYKFFNGSERSLFIEHYGRPFNYWRHKEQEEPALKRDIEGVLKSSGSFKPYTSRDDKDKTIGRFGLGFKSVFLITDCPKIHSGQWHFMIKSGCIPEEIPPDEIPYGMTRIELPMREDAKEISNLQGVRLADLLPFLRKITSIDLINKDERLIKMEVMVEESSEIAENMLIEKVVISGVINIRGGKISFIRCRHKEHQGQIALYIDSENLPAHWRDRFASDIYVALPLRVNLGCGISVSHLFDLQSGRIHLINMEANYPRFRELAVLLKGLLIALMNYLGNQPLNKMMLHFWTLWRWESGDRESFELRKCFASKLLELAEEEDIIPTLNSDRIISLKNAPIFYFEEIPDEIRDSFINAGVEVNFNEQQEFKLKSDNVVSKEFAHALIRTLNFVRLFNYPLICVNWEFIQKTFKDRPWLAEKPDILEKIASFYLDKDIIFDLISPFNWLKDCLLLAEDIEGNNRKAYVKDLFPWNFPDFEDLPKRFFLLLNKKYGSHVATFLQRLNLLSNQPSSDQIKTWIDKKLTEKECIGLLNYLCREDRWKIYSGLDNEFCKPWFCHNDNYLTIQQAYESGLIPEKILSNFVFKAWLGIRDGNYGEQQLPCSAERTFVPPVKDILMNIYKYWKDNNRNIICRYEKENYPDGKPLELNSDFYSNDIDDRRKWMILFIRATMFTMGRTKPEQHREFVNLCINRGWLNVFASPQINASEWVDILRDYLEDPKLNTTFYQWVKQFVSIFQIANWLKDYVEAFLYIDRLLKPFPIDYITDTRCNPEFQGGGPSAPSLTKTFGMGACFVIRELTRFGIIKNPYSYPHCYVPSRKLRIFLSQLGCKGLNGGYYTKAQLSERIYTFLNMHMGDEKATFDLSFDIPLLNFVENGGLQVDYLGEEINFDVQDFDEDNDEFLVT